MRKLSIIILILTAVVSSCGGGKKAPVSPNSGVPLYEPRYATHFRIDTVAGSPVIITLNPWQGVDDVALSYEVEKPARRIVATSSTHIAMLDALGALDCLVGVSGKQFVSNPAVALNDTLCDVGYDSNFDYETMLNLRPDLVLLYGVNGTSVMEKRLKELGIPFIYIGDYLEEHPLGKAEWLLPMGLVTGKFDEAKEKFSKLPVEYNKVKEAAASASSRPKVLLNAPYGDSWFLPPMGSYMVTFIEDAGGEYLYKENQSGSSQAVDMEKLYVMANDADVWLNPGMFASREKLLSAVPHLRDIPAVRNGMIFNNNLSATPAGGNDFYESGIVNPHLVLRDLVKIFHSDLFPDSAFIYYKPL